MFATQFSATPPATAIRSQTRALVQRAGDVHDDVLGKPLETPRKVVVVLGERTARVRVPGRTSPSGPYS